MDERRRRLLDRAVGPSPWYWRTFPPLLSAGHTYSWRAIEDDHVVILERSGAPAPVLALGFYPRPLEANPGYLLVWCPQGDMLEVSVFDVAALEPLSQDEWPDEKPRGAERRVVSHTPPVERIRIREGLVPGVHRDDGYCSRFADGIEEYLLLGDGPSGSHAMASIYVWRPRLADVEVLPQEWFTDDFDLGYEWITRVVRDPRTDRIVGDGIRIADFMLAEDGRTLAE
jgi:hypothetical protein